MKEVNKYIFFIGLGLLAISVIINYLFVRTASEKTINDSLKKARAEKERKRKERIVKVEKQKAEKEADEIIQSLQVMAEVTPPLHHPIICSFISLILGKPKFAPALKVENFFFKKTPVSRKMKKSCHRGPCLIASIAVNEEKNRVPH